MLSTVKHAAAQREAERALDGMARAAIDNVSAMAANGASQVTLQGVLDESRRIEKWRSLGMSAEDTACRSTHDHPYRGVHSDLRQDQEAHGTSSPWRRSRQPPRPTIFWRSRTVTTATNMDSSATGCNRRAAVRSFGPIFFLRPTAFRLAVEWRVRDGRGGGRQITASGLMHQINANAIRRRWLLCRALPHSDPTAHAAVAYWNPVTSTSTPRSLVSPGRAR